MWRGSIELATHRPALGQVMRGNPRVGQNSFRMAHEPVSPELVLVDPELGARARAALRAPGPVASARAPAHAPRPPSAAPAPPQGESHRPYPVWARVTAALWLLVIGILIGGAAIPHAQDRPRIVPADEASICELPSAPVPDPSPPTAPGETR